MAEKKHTTAWALAHADELLAAVKGGDRKAVAKVITSILDNAILCASVRVEREYGLKQRVLPGVTT